MAKLEMFVNGNFADGEEVYQIGTKNKDGIGQTADGQYDIVVFDPIAPINNKPARTIREIKIIPMIQSGIDQFRNWLKSQKWHEIFLQKSAHEKASFFQQTLIKNLKIFSPQK